MQRHRIARYVHDKASWWLNKSATFRDLCNRTEDDRSEAMTSSSSHAAMFAWEPSAYKVSLLAAPMLRSRCCRTSSLTARLSSQQERLPERAKRIRASVATRVRQGSCTALNGSLGPLEVHEKERIQGVHTDTAPNAAGVED